MDEKVTLEAGLPPPIVNDEPVRRRHRVKRLIPLVGLLALGWCALKLNGLGSSLVPSLGDTASNTDLYGLSRPIESPFKHKKEKHGGKHHGKHAKHGKHGKGGKHQPGHCGCGKHTDHFPPKKVEEVFLSVPDHGSVRDALRRYTKANHIAGNGQDKLDAINLKNEWERLLGMPVSGPEEKVYDAGSVESQESVRGGMNKLDVWVDTYYPLMTYPVTSSVTLLSDPPFKAKLQEDIVSGDPDSVLRDEVRPFHGYSVSGDVQAPIVYVGYGRKADFDLLAEKGVDVRGKIALVKYGGVFRGLKVKAAQEAGAVGCIIFTDPGDDGEITVENGHEEYPEGPARQPSSVQRGSVQYLSVYPGDPSTPGEPAYPNATRVESTNQPTIPSLPLSYEDVIPLLKSLQGQGILAKDIRPDWVGGLGYHGVEYWTGPSDVDVHLINEVNTRINPIWNTMGVIPGLIKDEVIIFGNHRDAWVLGASDPNSGTATQHELVRGLGELLKQGWQPSRTIILASWDAEEYGLVGSTEWTEDFGDWLQSNAAVYLNIDQATSGPYLGLAASPSLAWTLRNAASDVMDTNGSVSVLDRQSSLASWAEWKANKYGDEEEDLEAMFSSGTDVAPLGSGSDFTSFLQRYGIACGGASFGGGPRDPVYHYHSIYDSFTWMDKYGDPGFVTHINAAKIHGLVLLRLVDSFILPLNTTQYAVDMGYYLNKIRYIAKGINATDSLNLDKLAHSIDAVSSASAYLDIQRAEALDEIRKIIPGFETHGVRVCEGSEDEGRKKHKKHSWADWIPKCLTHKHDKDEKDGKHHHDEDDGESGPLLPRDPPVLDDKKVKKLGKTLGGVVRDINKKLQYFEGGFISEEGIKGREWYKHKGVAPGLWLGYGATTFPALTEALTIEHDVELAQKEADELADMLNNMAKKLRA